LSETHREALDHLLYGVHERKGFIAITGEIGAGKTTICRAILRKLEHGTKTSIVFNSNLPETQLLEAVLLDFGITAARRDKVSFFKAINEFLLKQLSIGNNVVLIIDEAQNLRNSTLETIRMLSNLETEKEKLLQIVLVGQPQLRDKLNLPSLLQLRQRIGVWCHVNALKNHEVRGYIEHRLNVAGPGCNTSFTQEAVDLIAAHSGGIPRVINIVCDKSLLLGFVLGTREINRAVIEKSIDEVTGNFQTAAR
jgi:general secretion pathway protein A